MDLVSTVQPALCPAPISLLAVTEEPAMVLLNLQDQPLRKTFTLPDANAILARTDAGQTFTGTQTFSGLIAANLGVTVGANQNLTMTSGDGTINSRLHNSVTGSGSA